MIEKPPLKKQQRRRRARALGPRGREPLCLELRKRQRGRTLQELRDALARAGCAISPQTVAKWLQGSHRPGRSTRRLLAVALERI